MAELIQVVTEIAENITGAQEGDHLLILNLSQFFLDRFAARAWAYSLRNTDAGTAYAVIDLLRKIAPDE